MKTLNEFIEEAASKRCPEGEYYCNTDKKCKKIPKGYKVTSKGWLRPLGGYRNPNNPSAKPPTILMS